MEDSKNKKNEISRRGLLTLGCAAAATTTFLDTNSAHAFDLFEGLGKKLDDALTFSDDKTLYVGDMSEILYGYRGKDEEYYRSFIDLYRNGYNPTKVGSSIQFAGGAYYGKSDQKTTDLISRLQADIYDEGKKELTQSELLFAAVRLLGVPGQKEFDIQSQRYNPNPESMPVMFHNRSLGFRGLVMPNDVNRGITELMKNYIDFHYQKEDDYKKHPHLAADINRLFGLVIKTSNNGGASGVGDSDASSSSSSGAAGAAQGGRGGSSGAGAN